MTSKVHVIPDEEQLSDDFTLVYFEGKHYALRHFGDNIKVIAVHKDQWICMSNAVDAIQEMILNYKPKKLIPSWDWETKKVIWLE